MTSHFGRGSYGSKCKITHSDYVSAFVKDQAMIRTILRHTCVALLIDQGADILYVSRSLGHKDIRTTSNTYGHLFPQRGQDLGGTMGEAMLKARTGAGRGKSVGNPDVGSLVERTFGGR